LSPALDPKVGGIGDEATQAIVDSLSAYVANTEAQIEALAAYDVTGGAMAALQGQNFNWGRKQGGLWGAWDFNTDVDDLENLLVKGMEDLGQHVAEAAEVAFADAADDIAMGVRVSVEEAFSADWREGLFGTTKDGLANLLNTAVDQATTAIADGGVVDYSSIGQAVEDQMAAGLQEALVAAGITQASSIIESELIDPFLNEIVAGFIGGGFNLQSIQAAYDKVNNLDIDLMASALTEVFSSIESGQEIDWEHFEDKYGSQFAEFASEFAEQGDVQEEIAQQSLDRLSTIAESSLLTENTIAQISSQLASINLSGGQNVFDEYNQYGFGRNVFGSPGHRASGGPVNQGYMYEINERGQEMYMPGADGRILNAQETQTMIATLKQIAAGPGMNGDVGAALVAIARYCQESSRVLKRWDYNGMPEARA
jgi:hypothetical protein